MKYPSKNLLELLKASNRFLEDPENEEKWRDFSEALQAIERYDVENPAGPIDGVKPQPESASLRKTLIDLLMNLDPESQQFLRRYYEKELRRPRYSLAWGALLIVFVSAIILVAVSGIFAPLRPLAGGETPSLSPTVTQIAKATAHVSRTAQIAAVPTAAPISTLINGQITGALTTSSFAVRYTFAGRAGDSVTITLTTADFDPYLVLQDTNGNEIASNDDCGSLRRSCLESLQLPEDGDYSVIVDSYDRRSHGTYTLSIPTLQTLRVTPLSTTSSQCPAAAPTAVVIGNEDLVNMRGGSSIGYPVVGIAYRGECFEVVGRNSNSTWVQIRTLTGRKGWIVTRLIQIEGDLTSVSVIDE